VNKSLQGWLHGPNSPDLIVLEHEVRVLSLMFSYLDSRALLQLLPQSVQTFMDDYATALAQGWKVLPSPYLSQPWKSTAPARTTAQLQAQCPLPSRRPRPPRCRAVAVALPSTHASSASTSTSVSATSTMGDAAAPAPLSSSSSSASASPFASASASAPAKKNGAKAAARSPLLRFGQATVH
jgi:hypothetical protein